MNDFDWVAERFKCSLAVMFEKLKIRLKADVAKREELKAHDAEYGFSFEEANKYAVIRLQGITAVTVRFELGKSSITCTTDGAETFRAIAKLGDDGKCRLRVDGADLDLWQVSKLALEDIFFNSV